MQSVLENKKKIEKSFIPKSIDNPHHSSQYISTVSFHCYPCSSLKELNQTNCGLDFAKLVTVTNTPRTTLST